MSIACLADVMKHSEATLGARLVIFVLAEHAHDDGSEAYPAVESIALKARLSRRAAQQGLRRLEEVGEIERDGVGPRGQTKWRITAKARGGADSAPREVDALGGRSSEHGGGAATSPEPPIEPTANRPRQEARVPARRDEAPEGFPDELRPHARAAYVVLRDIAQRRGAKAINARALATTIMARPRKPIVRAAHDLSAWLDDHPATACRDVLARYRRWLDREEDLAGVERLPGEGPAAMPGNVTPIRRGSAEDARQARQAQRLEVARREGLIE